MTHQDVHELRKCPLDDVLHTILTPFHQDHEGQRSDDLVRVNRHIVEALHL